MRLGAANKRLVFIVTFSAIAMRAACAADMPSERVPIQAELLKALESGKISVGDPVLARVDIAWKMGDCSLRKGAILKGRVVAESARSKTAKSSEIALLFDSGQCGGRDMKSLPLTVAAVVAADPAWGPTLHENEQSPPLSEAIGLGLNGGTAGNYSGSGMRDVSTAAATVLAEPPRPKPQKTVMPGQVIGLRDVTLKVGTGPEGSSVLSASKRNVRLEAGSQLVLVPNSKTTTSTETAANAATLPAVKADSNLIGSVAIPSKANDESDELDICAPPDCHTETLQTSIEPGLIAAMGTVSVKELGYAPRADRDMGSFDHDAAIAYLGPRELLFTFNARGLIRRSTDDTFATGLRIVRAVLIDLNTLKVIRSVDWRVPDANQYLWPTREGRVLVHVGRELRMYGPGLTLERKYTVDGSLAFLRMSPSSTYFAVGITQERHSEGIHRELAEAENREPEEDVQIKLMDASFHTLATVVRSSREVPPVLTDEGEVRFQAISRNRWRILEQTWNGQQRNLGAVESTCMPRATSLPPRLLFVLGCSRITDSKWYQVLRPYGKAMLKAWSPSAELEQTVGWSADSSYFAIAVTKAARALSSESTFRTSDLDSERVTVYRAENGARLFAVNIAFPVPTLQTFVLSEDGNQLAVLKADQISLYGVRAGTKSDK
jgi:hypothetical protein